MDTGEWLEQWLTTKVVTPRTLERYTQAVAALKESLAASELDGITVELVEKVTGEDQALRSVLAMALAQAVKAKLLKANVAAIRREQRKPQEGSLYYRANRKAWVAQVTIIESDGKRIVKTRLVKVERKTKNPPEAAIRALEELKALKASGGLVKGASPLSELMAEWLATLRIKSETQGEGLAARTFEQYSDISRHHIVPVLGKVKIQDLKRSQVESWLRTLEDTPYTRLNGKVVAYSANTLRLCRAVLGMALQWGMREGYVSRNVAREAATPGGRPRPEKHAMTEEQAGKLIESTRGTDLGVLWALMITTGLRRGEALGLRWQDFDGETISVTSQLKIEGGKVVRGELKTDKSKRRLRLPPYLIDDLEAHRARQIGHHGTEPELIFTNSIGSAIRPDNIQARFTSACDTAGIERHDGGKAWSVHELRHTAASQLLSDRVPMQIVSRTLGHSSVNVTMDVYAHLSESDSELAANSMSKRYGPKTDPK